MSIWNDVRHSFRALGREPGFAAAAILTVSLGVGANTAIFSIVNGVLLRPLPYAAPDRLVALREVVPAFAKMYPTLPVCVHHFVEWRARTKSFERLRSWTRPPRPWATARPSNSTPCAFRRIFSGPWASRRRSGARLWTARIRKATTAWPF